MRRWMSWVAGLIAVLAAAPAFAQTPVRGPFSDWAAIVVAGDWRASDGAHTEAFDNARRDIAATLVGLGFRPDNLIQFSTQPDRYPDVRPQRASAQGMISALKDTARTAGAGCLVYYTSHGGPPGVVLDVVGRMHTFSPDEMAILLDEACPGRPAIVIVSACYSGVFVPYLQGGQRMVMTAARKDRSSFGCSADARYPFFDDCFLQSVEAVRNFPALAPAIQACVARKEVALGLAPPSEPQVWIGGELRPVLAMMPFPKGAKAVRAP